MIYVRGELFYHQLRYIVGDSTLRQIMHTYYDRWKLKHVDEAAFEEVAEEVSHRDLSRLLRPVAARHRPLRLRGGPGAGGPATGRRQLADPGGGEAEGAGNDPGRGGGDRRARHRRSSGPRAGRSGSGWRWSPPNKPSEVVLDPRARTHDWNMLNNRRRSTLFGFLPSRRDVARLDRLFSTETRRDRVVNALLPTVWYNDQAGLTFGHPLPQQLHGPLRAEHLLGDPEHRLGQSTQRPATTGATSPGCATRSPPSCPGPTRYSGGHEHGGPHQASGLVFERSARNHLGFGPRTTQGVSLRWVSTTDDLGYLDPGFYEDAGTVEGQLYVRSADQ